MGIMIGAYLNPTERRPIHEVIIPSRPVGASVNWMGPGYAFHCNVVGVVRVFFLFFSSFFKSISRSNRHYRGFILFKLDALPSCKTAFTWHHNTQKGKEHKDRGGF